MTNTDADRQLIVLTYNLLYGGARAGTLKNWKHRREAVVRAIRHCQPDLLGVQECLEDQARFLARQLPGYGWVGRGREADGSGEMTAVFFRENRFEVRASGHFWLSETPDAPGSRAWDTRCTRIATWIRLQQRDSGAELLFANTHLDHGSEPARLGGARLLLQRLTPLASGAPLILTGDFNARAEASETWSVCMDGGLQDAWMAAPAVAGPDETWCDFRSPRYGAVARIDWVLFSGELGACFCESVSYREATGFPSDHLPVRAVLQLGPGGGRMAPFVRREAARALLVTPDYEVLLMCAVNPSGGQRVWFTPGGGLQPGETDREGLRRELDEETGRQDLDIGPQVWKRFHAFPWDGRHLHQLERFYLVNTPRFTPTMATDLATSELMSIQEFRWWTADEIDASTETFAPRRLAELLRTLKRDGPPPHPIDVGV